MTALKRLGVGTATFDAGYGLTGPALSAAVDERRRLLLAVLDASVRYIDTAGVYGDAERVLGHLAEAMSAHAVRVCSKIAARDGREAVTASLDRLRVPRLDTLLVHSASREALEDPDVVARLRALRRDGVATRIGASTYGADDAALALAQPWCDVVQVEHSILNPSVVARIAGAKRADQELIVRSVLCKGLLSGRRAAAAHLDPGARATLDALELCAAEWGMTLPELSIRFALDTPGADVVLVGVATFDELATAVRAAERTPLTDWQRERLAKFDASAHDWTHPERWAGQA